MFGSVILDVALALALVFLLLSVLCSSLREGIEAQLNSRAVHLHRGIVELLNNNSTNLATELYRHPQVGSLFEGSYDKEVVKDRPKGKFRLTWFIQWLWSKSRRQQPPAGTWPDWAKRRTKLPAYIPSRNFALALVDLVVRGSVTKVNAASAAPLSVQSVRDAAAKLDSPFISRAIQNAFDGTNTTLEGGLAKLEQWFDSSMERVTGWYKKETQYILFAIGLVVALIGNVDAVRIARTLYVDKPKREAIVQQATQVSGDSAVLRASAQQTRRALDSLALPVGWTTSDSAVRVNTWRFWERISGWLITALAVSFGAPFWFDLLSRFVQLRAATRPADRAEESKEAKPARTEQPIVIATTTASTSTPSAALGGIQVAAASNGTRSFVPHKWAGASDSDEGVI